MLLKASSRLNASRHIKSDSCQEVRGVIDNVYCALVQGLLIFKQTRIEIEPDESPHSVRCGFVYTATLLTQRSGVSHRSATVISGLLPSGQTFSSVLAVPAVQHIPDACSTLLI